jgi:hypothetical protein
MAEVPMLYPIDENRDRALYPADIQNHQFE